MSEIRTETHRGLTKNALALTLWGISQKSDWQIFTALERALLLHTNFISDIKSMNHWVKMKLQSRKVSLKF